MPRGVYKRKPRTVSPEAAVAELLETGQIPEKTKDAEGNELLQRPVSIDLKPVHEPPKHAPGKRVKVYNKVGAKLFTSDGFLEGHSEGTILESDLQHPSIQKAVVVLA